MQLPIDEDKWINCIFDTESKLKDRFKVPKNEEKISKKLFAQPALFPSIYMVILKYVKHSLKTLQFRPISSAMNTPTYLLDKYLNPILSPLTSNEYYVKSSFDFAEDVVNYDHDIYMASLAVDSLFASILSEKTIKSCVSDLFSKNVLSAKVVN